MSQKQNKKDKVDKREACNGIPLKEGEVLVPSLIEKVDIRLQGLSCNQYRTWNEAGVTYTVCFIAVPKDQEEVSMQEFNFAVNEYLDEKLGANRTSRCLIPQPDGSRKPCPKKRGNNRVACKDCPNRELFEKEDKSQPSLNEMIDDCEFCLASPDNTEEEVLLPIILKDLMRDLKEKDERAYTALKLLAELPDKNDVVSKLMSKYGLKKSMSYKRVKDAIKMVLEEVKL